MSITQVIGSFARDWEHLVSSADVGWARECPALAEVRSAQDVLDRIWGSQADEILGFLLGAHQGGQPLAGRIVLQTMLQKLVKVALKVSRGSHQAGEVLGDYVAALWIVIDSYPVDRRRRRIAANLFLDAKKQAWQLGVPQAASLVDPTSGQLEGWQEPQGAPEPLEVAIRILEVAEDLGLISSRVRAAMKAVYVDGLSGIEAAAEIGVRPESVRYHCSHGVRQLRPHRHALGQAA